MVMYDWLQDELDRIQTDGFHRIHIADVAENHIADLKHKLSPSYLEFINRFGGVRLFQRGFGHLLAVFNQPREVAFDDKVYLYIGYSDTYGRAFYREEDLASTQEPHIYEQDLDLDEDVPTETSLTFEQWIMSRYQVEQGHYDASEWAQVVQGLSFDQNEREIIEARKKYQWEVLEIDQEGQFVIRIANYSSIVLPFITIGVRAKDNSLQGAMYLPVADLAPGSEKIVSKDAYNDLISPYLVELYELPEPMPIDKESRWEFRKEDNS